MTDGPCKGCGTRFVPEYNFRPPYCDDCRNAMIDGTEEGHTRSQKVASNDRAFHTGWSVVKSEKECPTCGEMRDPDDFGWSHIDDELYDTTGETKWLKPKNPKQCKYCEWGSEA